MSSLFSRATPSLTTRLQQFVRVSPYKFPKRLSSGTLKDEIFSAEFKPIKSQSRGTLEHKNPPRPPSSASVCSWFYFDPWSRVTTISAHCSSFYYSLMRWPFELVVFLIFSTFIKLGLGFGHHNFAPFYGWFSAAQWKCHKMGVNFISNFHWMSYSPCDPRFDFFLFLFFYFFFFRGACLSRVFSVSLRNVSKPKLTSAFPVANDQFISSLSLLKASVLKIL